jgi:flagellar basal body-associated protein FliL
MSDKMICTTCGYVGQNEGSIKGNILIELILWCMFLLPGIIYSIYRSSSKQKVCPQCKNPTMIPVTSPIGEKLYTNHEASLTPEKKQEEAKKEIDKEKSDKVVKIIIAVLIIWLLYSFMSAFS